MSFCSFMSFGSFARVVPFVSIFFAGFLSLPSARNESPSLSGTTDFRSVLLPGDINARHNHAGVIVRVESYWQEEQPEIGIR